MLLMYSGEAGEEIGEDIEDDDDDDDEQVEADGDDDDIAEVASLDRSSRLTRKIFSKFRKCYAGSQLMTELSCNRLFLYKNLYEH